ncbi:hypothetical protein GpartN1_g5699.t1 [Galdieria partita]|uniref:Ribosomal protein n=1 Tax=Galdieria partita TaxID=83374 RepID=A0A9C7Q001_9RHOD|nr:hypothetical protein GpartN1_g5699.t1 [Galdieria partita]
MSLWKGPFWSLLLEYAKVRASLSGSKLSPCRSLFTHTRLEEGETFTEGIRNEATNIAENAVVDKAPHNDSTQYNTSRATNLSNLSENVSKLVYDKNQQYAVDRALNMVKESSNAGFDETIEACFQLNIDDRKPEQRIKDKILYPVSPIKHTLVAVFTKNSEEIQVAKEAGADYVGYEELLERIKKRRFKFYWLVSTPSSVKGLGSVSKILGPRGMMPTEKMGTLTSDIGFTVRELKKGYLRIENDPDSNVHSVLGKKSWSTESLLTNCCYLYEFLLTKKHRTIKKSYFKGLTLSSTMGPGIQVDLISLRELVDKSQQDKMKQSSLEASMAA